MAFFCVARCACDATRLDEQVIVYDMVVISEAFFCEVGRPILWPLLWCAMLRG